MKHWNWIILSLFVLFPGIGKTQPVSVGITVLLSGHIFIGFSAQYFWDKQNWVEVTVLPFVPGESGVPFAVIVGAKHAFRTHTWQPFFGGEIAVIASPAQDHQRNWLVMFNAVPGVKLNKKFFAIEVGVWFSSILRPRTKALLPTGIEVNIQRKI